MQKISSASKFEAQKVSEGLIMQIISEISWKAVL